jgi:hypothetical protein
MKKVNKKDVGPDPNPGQWEYSSLLKPGPVK